MPVFTGMTENTAGT